MERTLNMPDPAQSHGTAPDDPAERPDSDDYDLLTYGEVAARIDTVVRSETALLSELKSAPEPDEAAIEELEARIAELSANGDRYRVQAQTAETFMKRFGLAPRPRG
jgi:hypothetical protein